MLSLIWYIFLPTNSQLMLRYVLLTYWFPIHHAVDLNITLISFANNFRNIGPVEKIKISIKRQIRQAIDSLYNIGGSNNTTTRKRIR